MMAQSQTNNRRGIALILAALFVILILFSSGIGNFLRDMYSNIVAPSSEEFQTLSKDALIARLKDVEGELSRVRYQSLLYVLVTEENKSLRTALRAQELEGGTLGRVIARPPRTHFDTLLIDIGNDRGVAVGDTVLLEGIALGSVLSVGDKSALVQLFSSPTVERDVVLGNPEAVAVAKGVGGGAFELSLPQNVQVSVGEIVRTPGTRALVLGVVVETTAEPTDVSQIVRLQSPVAFSELDFVSVVRNP